MGALLGSGSQYKKLNMESVIWKLKRHKPAYYWEGKLHGWNDFWLWFNIGWEMKRHFPSLKNGQTIVAIFIFSFWEITMKSDFLFIIFLTFCLFFKKTFWNFKLILILKIVNSYFCKLFLKNKFMKTIFKITPDLKIFTFGMSAKYFNFVFHI